MTFSLTQAIRDALAREKLGFHMPGHAGGLGLPDWLPRAAGLLDTTELPHTDNLAQPETMLRAAQKRAARLFGAARTHFLVNGATGGILAMVQATVGPGDVLLVGRDCHRSVLAAVRLAGATPLFVNAARGLAETAPTLPVGPSAQDWLQAVAAHPEARALLITRPNYYGAAVDLVEIVRAAHAREMRVLVDEAHGAHFVASNLFPEPALACGADLVVQSLHKTLPAPSQTALLHESAGWPGPRPGLPVATVAEAVGQFQTSSPSWMLLALMDEAVGWLEASGADAYRKLLGSMEQLRMPADNPPGLTVLGEVQVPTGFRKDPTRLVLHARQQGTLLSTLLWRKHGIAVEMADPDHVVLITTPFHTGEDFQYLSTALAGVMPGLRQDVASPPEPALSPKPVLPPEPILPPEQVLPLAQALCRPRERVPLTGAVGRIAAAPVVPYPPGIAAIVPGERYDAALVASLCRLRAAGVSLNGMDGDAVWCVREPDET